MNTKTASVLDRGTNVSISLSATVTTKGKHRTHDADGNVVEETEFLPKRYVWKMTGAATGEAETDSSTHTFVASLTKGKDKKLNFSVVGKICSICDGEVESDEATDSVEIDVYELSISRPDYLGLDRTDEGRKSHAVTNARVLVSPVFSGTTNVLWTACGICEFVGPTNQTSVQYRNKDFETASESVGKERLVASVKLAGMDSSVFCSTNFTVVKVDVKIGAIGEDKEESEGGFVQYVPDELNGSITVEGTNKMVAVSFSCEPELPVGENVTVSFFGTGELFEALDDGFFAAVSEWSCDVRDIHHRRFRLHGHIGSAVAADGLVSIKFRNNEARDLAKYTVVKVGRLMYKCNSEWKDIPQGGFTNICLSSCIDFAVQPIPIGAKWPYGHPVWGGTANGNGAENKVVFNMSGHHLITVSCGNVLTGRVHVAEANRGAKIVWEHGYTCDFNTGDATTVERQFAIVFTACADVENDIWHLRVSAVTGGTDIDVHMGRYKTPIPGTNIVNSTDAASAIADMLLESSANGPASVWVTEDAIRAHETWHRDEWIELSEHYWPATEAAIELMTTPYHLSENDVLAAVSAMRTGLNGADAKIAAYQRICRNYWFTLGDSPGDRPYRAGGVVLNPLIEAIRSFGATQTPVWNGLPSGLNAAPAPDHCYQPWLPYNP